MHSARPFQNGFGEPVISLVLRDVLKGLRYLHALGYIHRYFVLITINGESFAGLNFHGFDPMKYFAEILSQFIGQECSQL